tara:strand:- start:104 stop:898 length:795 start_codon:yes stop_codon:yes gene_type:complete
MSIFGKLKATPERIKNVDLLRSELSKAGFTNPYLQGAILGVVAKESGFVPKSEISYKNTSADRIRTVFGSHFGDWSTAAIDNIKKNEVAFFNKIYGNRYGNAQNEGHTYRGRGFNQLTFKGNYEAAKKRTGINIVDNPDAVNQPKIAASVLVSYYKDRFGKYPKDVKKYVASGNPNDVRDLDTAIKLAAHANAGWGKSPKSWALTNAVKSTTAYAPFMYAYVKGGKAVKSATDFLKKNKKPILIWLTLGSLATITYFAVKKIRK